MLTNYQLGKKWGVDASEFGIFFKAMETKNPLLGRLYEANIRWALTEVDPKDSRLQREMGEREQKDGAALGVDPVVISIIFGVLSLIATALAPALKPIINQIIAFLDTILPLPLPPIP